MGFVGESVTNVTAGAFSRRATRYRRGNFRVVPAENRTAALEKDHRDMAVMIFSEPPTGRMMETLAAFEKEVDR
jgi:hypothetical protein